MNAKQALLIACLFGVACNGAPVEGPAAEQPGTVPQAGAPIHQFGDGELFMSYEGVGADTFEGSPSPNACWLAGPGQVVVIAELASDWQHEPRAICPVEKEYRWLNSKADAYILRSYPKSFSEDKLVELVFFSNIKSTAHLKQPDIMLASLREARGEWFVMEFFEIEASNDASIASQQNLDDIDLPSSWSDLTSELQAKNSNFSTSCTEPEHAGYGWQKLMSDSEFAEYIHTPDPESSCIPQEEIDDRDGAPDSGGMPVDDRLGLGD